MVARKKLVLVTLMVWAAPMVASAQEQSATGHWEVAIGQPGLTHSEGGGGVNALAVFDDGRGPALIAGGRFTSAGGAAAKSIARWDGTSWSALGSGIEGIVTALAVHDEGTHQTLYAGGLFQKAGGVSAANVARWDGVAWSPLGPGLTGDLHPGEVRALAIYDDGFGPRLYAGGSFGPLTTGNVAKWDGSRWLIVGQGVDGTVYALTVVQHGSSATLYAAGRFVESGGSSTNRIAQWTGTAWQRLGLGLNDTAYALAGTGETSAIGPALYVAGTFLTAGGHSAQYLAKWQWDTQWWSAVNPPIGSSGVKALTVFDDGSGPALYAGGSFTSAGGQPANNIARWDGTSWSSLGSGTSGGVAAILGTRSAPASEDTVFVGGGFTGAGNLPAASIAAWIAEGSLCGNCDGDTDVDLADFQALRTCLQGPGGSAPSPGCTCFDLNSSGRVDLADVRRFQNCFTGQR